MLLFQIYLFRQLPSKAPEKGQIEVKELNELEAANKIMFETSRLRYGNGTFKPSNPSSYDSYKDQLSLSSNPLKVPDHAESCP